MLYAESYSSFVAMPPTRRRNYHRTTNKPAVKQTGIIAAIKSSAPRQPSENLSLLFEQAKAGPLAAALVPWACDVLQSPNSRRSYQDDLRTFANAMREIGVEPLMVTGDHVRLFKESLVQAGKRPATIARAMSVIRGAYQQFAKQGLMRWETVQDIQATTSPRVDKNTTPGLSELEAKRLLHAPDTNTLVGLRDHALLFAYFITACRCSALLKARVGDIEQTDHRFYLIVREKGGKTQRKALLESDAPILRWLDAAAIRHAPEAPLFPAMCADRKTVSRRPLTRDAIRKMVKRYCREVGIEAQRLNRRGIGVHSLRKTAITNALEHGAKMEQVQQLAGHADIRTTQLYFQSRERDAEDASRHIQIR